MSDPAGIPSPAWLRPAMALPLGFATIAATNAVAIVVGVPWPRGGLAVRAAHVAVDALETLAVGVVGGALIGLCCSVPRVPAWLRWLVYAAVTTAVMHAVLGQDVQRQAQVALEGRYAGPLFRALVVLCGLAIPVAHALGDFLARHGRWVVAPLLLAFGGIVTNHAILRDDYPGLHAAIGWTAATLGGAALARRYDAIWRRWMARPWRCLAGVVAIVAAALVPPPNWLRLELFREPGAVGAWLLAMTVWSPPRIAAAPPPPSIWFADRTGLPPVAPTRPPLVERNPIVVMITIDAVRADAIADSENDKAFPTFAELKRTGAYFTRVTSPGSQTAVSLTTVFTGRYFSELRWAMHGEGSARFAYAASDPTPRFPSLLAEHGVDTASFCSLLFLANEFGVIRGFRDERMIAVGRRHAMAVDMVNPVLDRLRRADDGPLLLYVHLMEPHAPYDRGAKRGTDREKYLSEIAVADAQLGRVAKLLSQKFADRAFLVVAADHGEAFGEHGTFLHTKTLYDELLRVPLLVRGPGVAARRVDQHVGLIDIGPTILDLFGVDTPAHSMGQSLVPLLAGRDPSLERPLFAEGRMRRAFFDGSLKVIEDGRRKVVEAYDLSRDPQELDNLFDADRARVEPALAKLRAFFDVHAQSSRDAGYTPPYKP